MSTINAVYSLAEGIHRTLQQKCGVNYNGLCSKYLSDGDTYDMVMENMDKMNFTDLQSLEFKFIEREAAGNLEFHRFNILGEEEKVSYTVVTVISTQCF